MDDRPEKYRPTALLNIKYKLLASMLHNGINQGLDNRIHQARFGLKKARSTAQLIHIYRRAQEIHEGTGLELVTIPLDWDKAFDKISQDKQMLALSRIGIPGEITEAIQDMYREPTFVVREGSNRSSAC